MGRSRMAASVDHPSGRRAFCADEESSTSSNVRTDQAGSHLTVPVTSHPTQQAAASNAPTAKTLSSSTLLRFLRSQSLTEPARAQSLLTSKPLATAADLRGMEQFLSELGPAAMRPSTSEISSRPVGVPRENDVAPSSLIALFTASRLPRGTLPASFNTEGTSAQISPEVLKLTSDFGAADLNGRGNFAAHQPTATEPRTPIDSDSFLRLVSSLQGQQRLDRQLVSCATKGHKQLAVQDASCGDAGGIVQDGQKSMSTTPTEPSTPARDADCKTEVPGLSHRESSSRYSTRGRGSGNLGRAFSTAANGGSCGNQTSSKLESPQHPGEGAAKTGLVSSSLLELLTSLRSNVEGNHDATAVAADACASNELTSRRPCLPASAGTSLLPHSFLSCLDSRAGPLLTPCSNSLTPGSGPSPEATPMRSAGGISTNAVVASTERNHQLLGVNTSSCSLLRQVSGGGEVGQPLDTNSTTRQSNTVSKASSESLESSRPRKGSKGQTLQTEAFSSLSFSQPATQEPWPDSWLLYAPPPGVGESLFSMSDDSAASLAPLVPLRESEAGSKAKRGGQTRQQTRVKRGRSQGWTGPVPQRQNSNDSIGSSVATPETTVKRGYQRDRYARTNATVGDVASPGSATVQVRRGSTANRHGEKIPLSSEESGKEGSVAGDRLQLDCPLSRGMTQESILQLSDASSSSTREGNTPALGPQETASSLLFLEKSKHGPTHRAETPARGVGGGGNHRDAHVPVALKADVSLGGNRPHYHVAKQEWRVRYYMNGKRKMRTYSAKFYGYDTAHNMAKDFAQYVDKHDALPDSMMMTAMMLQAQANANSRAPLNNMNVPSSRTHTPGSNSPRPENVSALHSASPGPHEESRFWDANSVCAAEGLHAPVARCRATAGDHASIAAPGWGPGVSGGDVELKVRSWEAREIDDGGDAASHRSRSFTCGTSVAGWRSDQKSNSPQQLQWVASSSEDSGSSTHQSNSLRSTPLSGTSPVKHSSGRTPAGYHESEDSQQSLFRSAHARSQEFDENTFASGDVASHLLASALSPPVSRGNSMPGWLGERTASRDPETNRSLSSPASTPILARRALIAAAVSPLQPRPQATGTGKSAKVVLCPDKDDSCEVRLAGGAETSAAVRCVDGALDSREGSRENGEKAALGSFSLNAFQKLEELSGSCQHQGQCLSELRTSGDLLQDLRCAGVAASTLPDVSPTGAKGTTAATAVAATAVSHQILDTIDLFGEFIRGFAKEKVDEFEHLDVSKESLYSSPPRPSCFAASCRELPAHWGVAQGRGPGGRMEDSSISVDCVDSGGAQVLPSPCGTTGNIPRKLKALDGIGPASGEEDFTPGQLDRLHLARGMLPRQGECAMSGLSHSELVALSRALVDLTSSTYILMDTLKTSLASSTSAVYTHRVEREAAKDEQVMETEDTRERQMSVAEGMSVRGQESPRETTGETHEHAGPNCVTKENSGENVAERSPSSPENKFPAGERRDTALVDATSLASLSPLFSLIKRGEDIQVQAQSEAALETLTGEKRTSGDLRTSVVRKMPCSADLSTTKPFSSVDGEVLPTQVEEKTRPTLAPAGQDTEIAGNAKRAEVECQVLKQEGDSKAVSTRTTTAGSTPWSPGSLAFASVGAQTPVLTRTSTANGAFSSTGSASGASPVISGVAAADGDVSVTGTADCKAPTDRLFGGDFTLPSSCKMSHRRSNAEASVGGSSSALPCVSACQGKAGTNTHGTATPELKHSNSIERGPTVVETAFALLHTHQRLATTISSLQEPVEKQLRFILRIVRPLLLPCVLPPVTKNEVDETSPPSVWNESLLSRARCASDVAKTKLAKRLGTDIQNSSPILCEGVAGREENQLSTEHDARNGCDSRTCFSGRPQVTKSEGNSLCDTAGTSQQHRPHKRSRADCVTDCANASRLEGSEGTKRTKISVHVSSCGTEAGSPTGHQTSLPSPRVICDEQSLADFLLSPFKSPSCPCSDRPCPCDRQHVADMIYLLYSIPGRQRTKAPESSQCSGEGHETSDLDEHMGREFRHTVRNSGEGTASENRNIFQQACDALRQACVFKSRESAIVTPCIGPAKTGTEDGKKTGVDKTAVSQDSTDGQSDRREEGSDGQTCCSSRSVSADGVIVPGQGVDMDAPGSKEHQIQQPKEMVLQELDVDMASSSAEDRSCARGFFPSGGSEQEKPCFPDSDLASLSLVPLPSLSAGPTDTQDSLGDGTTTNESTSPEDQAAKDASAALAMAGQALVLFSSSATSQRTSKGCEFLGAETDSAPRGSKLSPHVALLRLSYPAMLACSLPLQSLLHTVAGMILSLHKKLIYRFICSHLRVPLLTQEGCLSATDTIPESREGDGATQQSAEKSTDGAGATMNEMRWQTSDAASQIMTTKLQKDSRVKKSTTETDPGGEVASALRDGDEAVPDRKTRVLRDADLPFPIEESASCSEAAVERATDRWEPAIEGEGTRCRTHPLQVKEHEQCSSTELPLDTTRMTVSETESCGGSISSVGSSDPPLACLFLQKPTNSGDNANHIGENYRDTVNSCDVLDEENTDDASSVSTTQVPCRSTSASFSDSYYVRSASGGGAVEDSTDAALSDGGRIHLAEKGRHITRVVGQGEKTLEAQGGSAGDDEFEEQRSAAFQVSWSP
ncbi:ap2 domain transcription factor ap2iv-4 [Cystoisospora suis]|uniref:Ap2 domain transcription factor ap2iv-4 n=1 Tax=Cystoisospora suis TaxID=483139 RepID=A0A2C6LFY1_9APIC|nr:ap2 domain transcription factor ap2iv-4 [Cystoisospora suis]